MFRAAPKRSTMPHRNVCSFSIWPVALLLLGLMSSRGYGQTGFEAGRAVLLGVQGSYLGASGDWSEQFSDLALVGPSVGFKTGDNWIFSLGGSFGFGDQARDVRAALGPLLTDKGQILNLNGNFAKAQVFQRMVTGRLEVDKLLPFWRPNRNSGPLVGINGGMAWHWLGIQNLESDVPPLTGASRKGYDQMHQGLILGASLGYNFMSRNERINLSLRLELAQMYTRSVRQYHYAEGTAPSGIQANRLYGLKIHWFIPLYQGGKSAQYYYK